MSEIVLKGIPTFRILDYGEAKTFYIEGLGFKIDWEHKPGPDDPVYVQISRNGLTLHLSENDRFRTGVIVFVECQNLNQFYTEIKDHTALAGLSKPEETYYHTIQMEVEDPFGNLLRFNEAIDV